MSAQGNARPIIKRKKIVKAAEHHGGAWKVAYADFVTAMMAFFMLMWLLGATTEKQRKGIADYFNPTISVSRLSGGGEGAFGGDSVYSEETMAQSGTGAGVLGVTVQQQAGGAQGAAAREESERALAEVEKALLGFSGESLIRDLIRRHVVTRLSDEGLVIELLDTETSALFRPDGTPAPALRALMPPIIRALSLVENTVAVEAHVALDVAAGAAPWERSVDRGSRLRGLLEAAGLPPPRIARLTGFADREPIAADPASVRNNRLAIVLLRNLG
jgi:chemotaxis protein MotB